MFARNGGKGHDIVEVYHSGAIQDAPENLLDMRDFVCGCKGGRVARHWLLGCRSIFTRGGRVGELLRFAGVHMLILLQFFSNIP